MKKINPALWTDRAGDIRLFILTWTVSHLATGPAVGGKRSEKKDKAHRPRTTIPHVYP